MARLLRAGAAHVIGDGCLLDLHAGRAPAAQLDVDLARRHHAVRRVAPGMEPWQRGRGELPESMKRVLWGMKHQEGLGATSMKRWSMGRRC